MTDPTCIYCKLIAREVPCAILYEDERTFAFLDIHPMWPGHSLVIPKAHAPTFKDMTDDDAAAVALTVKRIGKMLDRTFHPNRVGIIVKGFDVPHAHHHVFPMEDNNDIMAPKYGHHFPPQASPEELERVRAQMLEA